MTTTEKTAMTEVVREWVGQQVGGLQRGYLANRSAQVAALARLRRGLGKAPGEVLDILEYTTSRELVGQGGSDDPSFAEIAAHQAITLFAMHQQSLRRPMHQRGPSLGAALRRLVGRDLKPEHPVVRRFTMLGTAQDFDEVAHHLRGLVQLLRTQDIPLDYGLLAADLLRWQHLRARAGVRLRWGRDFYTSTPAEPDQN